jgi:hypothetical protein
VNNGHVCVIHFGYGPPGDRLDLLSYRTHIIFIKHATAGVTVMLAGIVLILAGILLVVFPPLLSMRPS